jgi:hypothetical protein
VIEGAAVAGRVSTKVWIAFRCAVIEDMDRLLMVRVKTGT